MKAKCINWNKIIANAGLVFFSTLGAVSFAGSINALQISAINAFIMAGIAFFSEFKLEIENEYVIKTQRVISGALLL